MRFIELNGGQKAIVDDVDYPLVSQYRYSLCGGRDKKKYAMRWIKSKNGEKPIHSYLHWDIIGKPLNDLIIDHKNRNLLDCRRKNLRVCTPSQNHHNKSARKMSNRTSKYKGVRYRKDLKKPWLASINVNGNNFELGSFKTEQEAAIAYNQMAKQHFGKFANLNKISS